MSTSSTNFPATFVAPPRSFRRADTCATCHHSDEFSSAALAVAGLGQSIEFRCTLHDLPLSRFEWEFYLCDAHTLEDLSK